MKLIDINLLYDSYLVSMKGSSWKKEPQKFSIDFLSELCILKEELENHTYKTLQGSEFILNERGKIRALSRKMLKG